MLTRLKNRRITNLAPYVHIWPSHFEQSTPLQNRVHHFTDCIHPSSRPLTAGAACPRLACILEVGRRTNKAQIGSSAL